jgi:hypothetical protein
MACRGLHRRFVLPLKQQALRSFAMPGVRVIEEGDEVGGARGLSKVVRTVLCAVWALAFCGLWVFGVSLKDCGAPLRG